MNYQRGLKRSLDVDPHTPYEVFAYLPALCDKVLRHEHQNPKEHLPNVRCSGCPSSFVQKSITDYTINDEAGHTYADLQFHHHGGLCIWCRAPYPGEGHFEQRHVHDGITANPLTEYLQTVGVEVSALQDIVWEYYKPLELPKYTQLKKEHKNFDQGGLYHHVAYMSFPGVEHVYLRNSRYFRSSRFDLNDETPDIKLDYRYWRPKNCNCTKVPCECICHAAQVHNITQILKSEEEFHWLGEYNMLGTLRTTNDDHEYNKANFQTFFVYLRECEPLNPDEVDTENDEFVNQKGVCHPEHVGSSGETFLITAHTPECRRRNTSHITYKCIMDKRRCGRCADCQYCRW